MKKRFLLMATAIVTAFFVSGQPVAANAEESVKESTEVITEKGSSEEGQITEEQRESVNAEAKAAGDSIGSATPISLGTGYEGWIVSGNPKDFYQFTLSSSGRVQFTGSANIKVVSFRIYNSAGKEVWATKEKWESATQTIVMDESIDLIKGTYYFAVLKDNTYSGNYNFRLGFSGAGESFTETGSNNTMAKGDAVTFNRSYKGQLAENDDKDFYKFTLSSSRKVTFSATTGMKDIHYRIYNASGSELWSAKTKWNSVTEINSASEAVTLSKGTYYLAVSQGRSSYTGIYTGTYTFKLSTHSHSYKNVVSKATPSRNGKIVKKCSCGATNGTSVIYAPKKMSVSASKYTYNGKVRTPSVVVKDSKGRTVSRSNYKVTYSKGRKYVGRYTVKVTFKGNYSGSISKKFDIVPKGTSLSKVSKGRKSLTVKWKKKSSQTSGYQVQYSTNSKFKKGNKTVTIKSNKSSVKKITKLKAKKKYYVRVRTYKNVKISGKTVKLYSGWSKAKAVRTK